MMRLDEYVDSLRQTVDEEINTVINEFFASLHTLITTDEDGSCALHIFGDDDQSSLFDLRAILLEDTVVVGDATKLVGLLEDVLPILRQRSADEQRRHPQEFGRAADEGTCSS